MKEYAKSPHGLLMRLGSAVARPWCTSYVCPTLMTLTAALYALRGYEPYWSAMDHDGEQRDPSRVCYRIFRTVPTDSGRWPSHGVELHCLFPRWMILTECWLRNTLGLMAWRVRSRFSPVPR